MDNLANLTKCDETDSNRAGHLQSLPRKKEVQPNIAGKNLNLTLPTEPPADSTASGGMQLWIQDRKPLDLLGFNEINQSYPYKNR